MRQEIERLEIENERLRRELERWRNIIKTIRLRCEREDNLKTRPFKKWLDDMMED